MHPFEVRGALKTDEDQLLAVAEHLDTVNLPNDRGEIAGILEHAVESFTGRIKDPRRRTYVFVLVDSKKEKIVGTSMIIGQLGRRDAPYIYLDVIQEERYSATLDKHFNHTTLNVGYSYNGPTEIGGLVLDPAYRRVPERLRPFIFSFRFFFMKGHPELFFHEILPQRLSPP